MRVALICVNYNSNTETRRYLQSLIRLEYVSKLQVVVVDNPAVGAPAFDETEFRHALTVRVLRPGSNLGYLGGAAAGFREHVAPHGLPDFCIISNVDLEIEQRDFLTRLEARLGEDRMGIIAPSIRSRLTSVEQNPFLRVRPPRLKMHGYRWLFASYPIAATCERFSRLRKVLRGRSGKELAPVAADIYAPHGSFVVLTRRFFSEGGSLEYRPFLFGEEIHLGEQVRRMNLRTRFCPDLQVWHDEHVSVGRYRSKTMMRHAYVAARFCAEEYFSD